MTEEFFADESEASTFEVTVGTPVQGKCSHPSTGCHKPETGDIVQTFPITIRNTGPDVLTIGFGSFVLEYEDGTRLVTTDGSTSDYASVTALDYEQRVRSGATYQGTLTFEAPRTGKATVIMLSGDYIGDDVHGWVR